MNSTLVNKIKKLCREQETSLTKLEAEFGWGNGTIGKWAKSKKTPPIDRLQKIADRLGVTIALLMETTEPIDKDSKPINFKKYVSDKEAFIAAMENMNREDLFDIVAAATKKLRDKDYE